MVDERYLHRLATLDASPDMEAVCGTVSVAIPLDRLWRAFTRADLWPQWNRCFCWAWNRDLVAGRQLIWCFNPIRRRYLYRMPAIARIVSVKPLQSVTWEVTALPGLYAQHTYSMEALPDGRTQFGSWEKAQGWGFRLSRRFWIAHFRFVKDASLEGAAKLAERYRRDGALPGGGS